MRGIRQLALANLVYPGALHTRFDHTLGVAHVARLMAEQLKVADDELRLITLAALLHDAGHGPFSHVSEASLDRFGDPSKLQDDQQEHKIHEAVTAQIVLSDPELSRLLPDADRQAVVRLLGRGHGRPALKQIVSGPLDADKQDYLLRDSHFCGVQYGRYDLGQLHRSLDLPEPNGELMIDEDGVHAVEQFVLAKYYMTANVYRHRVRRIADQMLTRAIRLGIEADRLEPMKRLYEFDGSAEFVTHYQKWDDARFLETFCPTHGPSPGAASGAMLKRLRDRKLLKEVFHDRIDPTVYGSRMVEILKGLHKQSADELAKAVERRIAEYLSRELNLTGEKVIAPDFVIGSSFGIKSARESSRNDEQGFLVNVSPYPQEFTVASTLFRSINEAYADHFVTSFAPVEWPAAGDKDALRAGWKEAIRQIVRDEWKKVKS